MSNIPGSKTGVQRCATCRYMTYIMKSTLADEYVCECPESEKYKQPVSGTDICKEWISND